MASTRFSKHAANSATAAADEVHSAAEHFRGALHESAQCVRATVGGARSEAEAKAETLRRAAGDYYQSARDEAQRFERGLAERIREKPLTAVAIAAAVGSVLGTLWSRR